MVYDIVPFLIIIVSLIIIFFIIAKKFSLLSQIDIENLPAEQQARVKEKIVVERIKRRLINLKEGKIFQILKSIFFFGQSKIKKGFEKLLTIEKKLKEKEKSQAPDQDIVKREIASFLVEAEELKRMNQIDEAEKRYIQVVKLDNKNKEAYQGLAEIYYEKKEYEQAKEIYKHLLKLNKQDESLYALLGRVSIAQGNFLQAEKNYLKSLKIQERSATYIDLAFCYKAMEKFLEAQETLKKSLELDPNNPRLLDLLIEISIILKDKNLAKHYWQRLAEVNPENQKLPELIEVIDKL